MRKRTDKLTNKTILTYAGDDPDDGHQETQEDDPEGEDSHHADDGDPVQRLVRALQGIEVFTCRHLG